MNQLYARPHQGLNQSLARQPVGHNIMGALLIFKLNIKLLESQCPPKKFSALGSTLFNVLERVVVAVYFQPGTENDTPEPVQRPYYCICLPLYRGPTCLCFSKLLPSEGQGLLHALLIELP